MKTNSMNHTRKTAILLILAAALLLMCLPSALAVSGDDMIIVTVDKCKAGSDYMLLLVKPGTSASGIGESSLLFADQLTASGSTIRAAVVLPDFSACDVYAAGDFSNAAASPRKVTSYTANRLPQQTAVIDDAAFENTAFTHIYLGGSLTSIGSRAFAACANLLYVYIPAGVKTIDSTAFANSPNVTIGCPRGSAACEFAIQNGVPYVIVNP